MNAFENMSSLLLLLLAIRCSTAAIYDNLVVPVEQYELPPLPYSYKALEPFIDAATLAVHHHGHHKIYTDKLNDALVHWRTQVSPYQWLLRNVISFVFQHPSALSAKSLVELLQRLVEIPDQWRTAIRNNGGGYANHVLYWATMCGSPAAPGGTLVQKINNSFGDINSFKQQFSEAAKTLFGSGYVWLCQNETEDLQIVKTQNQASCGHDSTLSFV